WCGCASRVSWPSPVPAASSGLASLSVSAGCSATSWSWWGATPCAWAVGSSRCWRRLSRPTSRGSTSRGNGFCGGSGSRESTPEELKAKLDGGEDVMVVDVRHRVEFESEPTIIPVALHLMIEELEARQQEVPRDRDIVLYCT